MTLFEKIDCSSKSVVRSIADFPDLSSDEENRAVVLLNGNFNHQYDIQSTLVDMKRKLSRSSRVVAVCYNSYLRVLYSLANFLGVRRGELPTTFVTVNDLKNLAKISDYELVRGRPVAFFPFKLFGFGSMLNRVLQATPVLRWFGFAEVVTLRPIIASKKKPSMSIVIPARNERGNIENALKRLPVFEGTEIEVIFVEGHSTDNTWEEIQRVADVYKDRISIQCYRQLGKGKADAVRMGFGHSTKDLLTILDADLTMPPEMLVRFYDAYVTGKADFVNGNRLLYSMEDEAMRFLNRLGNIFFAKALSFVLDARLGDSLCGTKLLSRRDYERFVAWRKNFGDFDPFGDFELLFPAATLGLGICDMPIRYQARTYGSTNISRFRHGLVLLKMTLVGLFRIRMGRIS